MTPLQTSYWRATFTDPTNSRFHRWHAVINFWIFVSCLTMAMETVEPFATIHQSAFIFVEFAAVAFFTVDYIASMYFAENRLKYFFSFWGMVDLISILPTFLMLVNLTALQGAKVFRLLRVVRVLRVLKMARTALQQLTHKVKDSNPIITNLRIYFIALFSVMMISSTLMYYAEGGLYSPESIAHGQTQLDAHLQAHPLPQDAPADAKKFMPIDPVSGNNITEDKRFYTSIPAAMWWCIVTLTTTGYGDMYPVTFWGRVIAGATMLMGLVLFGILMNIVGKTMMVLLFGEQMEESGNAKPSKESLLKSMLEMGLIDEAQLKQLLNTPER